MATIEVRYKPIAVTGGIAYHKYIIYTDNTGKEFYARGGMGDDEGIFESAGGLGGGSFPLGDIITDSGEYIAGTKDWNASGTPDASETVATGDDLSSQWKKIVDRMNQIEREHHDYKADQNSNTAADDAIRAAGLPEATLDGIDGYVSPGSATGAVKYRDFWRELMDKIKSEFQTAQTIVSPIVLDLNGDGITTTGLNAGTHFDHDADGFAESTGWVNAQDGILVRDLDGNGTIDTGRELFGSETLLASGQKAANGYEALAELDTNLDGQINAQDAAYATLQIWKDANGDGYSSADELYTLADAGVQSIATGYVEVPHIVEQSATYTRTDNSTGDVADLINSSSYANRYMEGILMVDTNGTGFQEVDSGYLLANGQVAANAYQVLAELDSNHDGLINAQDADYGRLQIWKDTDSNGYYDTRLTLAEAGIQSITASILTDASGNAVNQTGTYARTDNSTGASADIWFQTDHTHTLATDWLPETAAETTRSPITIDLNGDGTGTASNDAVFEMRRAG